MTLSTTTSRVVYAGNGVTTIFSFPYRFLANGDLEVTVFDAAGLPDTQVLTTDYTVTGADADAGGSVTMVIAPAVGESLVIRRVVDLTQETDYNSGDAFPAETHERALDKLTMMDQQLQEQVDRTIRIPLDNITFDGQLPDIVPGRFLRVNDSGTALELVSVVESGELVVTPYIETLLDDTNAAAARATLVVPSRTGADASGTWPISITGNAGTVNGLVTGSGLTMTTARVLGRTSASTGAVQELDSAAVRTFAEAVRTSGNETIAGIKTFSTAPVMSSGLVVGTSVMGNPAGNAPSYPCRAWCSWNGTTAGTNAPTIGGNIATVQRVSVGIYTLTFTTPLNTAGYAIAPCPSNNISPTTIINFAGSAPTVSAFTIACVNAAGTAVDPSFITIMVIC